jgi:hypothetical protein
VYSLVRHDCDDIATSDHAKDSYSVRCQHAVIAGSGRSSDDTPLQNVMLKRTPLEGLERSELSRTRLVLAVALPIWSLPYWFGTLRVQL